MSLSLNMHVTACLLYVYCVYIVHVHTLVSYMYTYIYQSLICTYISLLRVHTSVSCMYCTYISLFHVHTSVFYMYIPCTSQIFHISDMFSITYGLIEQNALHFQHIFLNLLNFPQSKCKAIQNFIKIPSCSLKL